MNDAAPPAAHPAAHPWVPPDTPVFTLPDGTVRIGGVDGQDGLVVSGGAEWVGPLVRGLSGGRSERAVLAEAAGAGVDPVAVQDLLDGLRVSGLSTDLDPADLLAADPGPAARARTALELPAVQRSAGGPRRPGWRARRAAQVAVDGANRVGAPLAALLSASGIGRVQLLDRGTAGPTDAVVGGLSVDDEGRPRSLAAADAVRRARPGADLRPVSPGQQPDLVVLCRPWAAVDPLTAAWQRTGTPHLVATVRGETGVVGPLVVPGVSSCLRCGDLHRRDADPDWPVLASQLTRREPAPSGATLTCLATAVTAALQVLAHIDAVGAPAAVDATIELRLPDLVPRRRPWPPHPSCGCTEAAGTARQQVARRGTLER